MGCILFGFLIYDFDLGRWIVYGIFMYDIGIYVIYLSIMSFIIFMGLMEFVVVYFLWGGFVELKFGSLIYMVYVYEKNVVLVII